MRAVWPFVRLNLLGRPRRTALLALAIAFAAALVIAVVSLVVSGQSAVERRLVRSVGAADAIVGHSFSSDFEESVLEEVRDWPGVVSASGRLRSSLTLIREDRRRDDEGLLRRVTVECRGFDLDDADRFDQLDCSVGRVPRSPGEIVIDPLTADHLDAVIGDRLEVQRFGDPLTLEVVGIQNRPVLGGLQRPTAHLARDTLAEAADAAGKLTAISIILEPDTDVAAWCAAQEPRLAAHPDLEVETSDRIRAGFDRGVAGSRLALSLLTIMSFLSCSFIVATGMTTAVIEQQRILAICRCIGAARGHLIVGQLLAGLLLGAIGGLAGIPVALGLLAAAEGPLHELLTEGISVPLWGVGLALCGAMGSGVLGAAFPALKASRVPPLEALRARARPARPWKLALCTGLGLLALAGQLGLLQAPDRDVRFLLHTFFGFPLLAMGWFLLGPPAFRLLAEILSKPISRVLRLPRGVLEGSVRATPYRFGFTAGALMLGLALLVVTWTDTKALDQAIGGRVMLADGFVFRTGGLSPAQQRALAALPGAIESCPIGYLPLEVIGEQVFGVEGIHPKGIIAVGFDPVCFRRLNRLEYLRGDEETASRRLLEGDAVLVAEQFLVARGLDIGDSIEIGNARHSASFEIVGVVRSVGLDLATKAFGTRSLYNEMAISCVFLDFEAVATHFSSRDAFIMQVQLDPTLGAEGEDRFRESVIDAVPGTFFASGRQIKGILEQLSAVLLGVAGSVSGMAMLLAGLGMANVIAAGISARRFEFGLMRSVGASRGVVARLVLAEAFLVALAASVTGLTYGYQLTLLSRIWYRDLVGINLEHQVHPLPLAAGVLALLLVAVASSTPAAWRLLRRPTVELLADGRGG